jgi:hypothetical protein
MDSWIDLMTIFNKVISWCHSIMVQTIFLCKGILLRPDFKMRDISGSYFY